MQRTLPGKKSKAAVPCEETKPFQTSQSPISERRRSSILSSAARAFGIAITPTEVAFWKATIEFVRAIDDLVDNHGRRDVLPVLYDVVSGLEHPEVPTDVATAFTDALRSRSKADQERILCQIATIPFFAERKREARSHRELKSASSLEAKTFAEVLGLEPNDPTRIRFNHWLKGISQAAQMLDQAVDLRQDKRRGRISVEGEVRNSLGFLLSSLRHSIDAGRRVDLATNIALVKGASAWVHEASLRP